jgi:hypothetical protein
MVNTAHLVGVAEGAAFFGVAPATFSNWAYQRNANRMPLPVKVLGSGTFYDLGDLLPWWTNWKPVKGSRAGTVSPLECVELGLVDSLDVTP